jgi:hypothetical protein
VLGAQAPPAGFAPVVDGTVIPRHPFDPTAPEVSADVPIIVSTTWMTPPGVDEFRSRRRGAQDICENSGGGSR